MHPINKKSKLPIKPTHKPSPQEMAVVSTAAINMVQKSILSPAAVIACLKCSYDLYLNNALSLGFDKEAAAECEKLGATLALALKKSGVVKTGGDSPIVVPDSGLVAPDGRALPSMAEAVARIRAAKDETKTYATAPAQCQNEKCDSMAPLIKGSVNSRDGWFCDTCRFFHEFFPEASEGEGVETSDGA